MLALSGQLSIFYLAAGLLLGFAMFVILSNQPVKAILALIACFVCATVLWLLLEAEFLALALVFVYIGAVMTLFLFVVMMMNLEQYAQKDQLNRTKISTSVVIFSSIGLVLGAMFYPEKWVRWSDFDTGVQLLPYPADYSNTMAIGKVLYTETLWPFQLSALILLVAMIVAVGLVYQGRRPQVKAQNTQQQLSANKGNRLKYAKIVRRKQ